MHIFNFRQRKSCGTCAYHKERSAQDQRGYFTGEMCVCKNSDKHGDFTDDGYGCKCHKKRRKR